MAQDELTKIQEQLQLPHLKVPNDLPTRWKSTLHMLKRTEEIKEPLSVYVAKNSKVPQITNVEWLILSQSVKALEQFEELTKKMSESTSTVADVLPHIVCLTTTMHSQLTTVDSAPTDSDLEDASQDDNQTSVKIVNYMVKSMKADIDMIFAGIELDNNY